MTNKFFRFKSLLILITFATLLWNCDSASKRRGDVKTGPDDPKAQEVVDLAIKVHGGELYSTARIEFDFRGRHYVSERNNGTYTYQRIFQDTLDDKPVIVKDVLDNNQLTRFINETPTDLSRRKQNAFSSSVNSVLYFAQLPFLLNDPAVNKHYLGETEIRSQPYYKIQITFGQEGGGEDFEDVYLYWFHREMNTLDYLAYSYEDGSGGVRFREAINPRVVSGIRFADYINYKSVNKTTAVQKMEELFKQGELVELSRIINENVEVILPSG